MTKLAGVPHNYSPIWGAILFFLGLQLLYSITLYLWKRRQEKQDEILTVENKNFEEKIDNNEDKKIKNTKKRLNSLGQSLKFDFAIF